MASEHRQTRDERLIIALACGRNLVDASRECGYSQRTVNRRVADSAFQTRLKTARAEMFGRASGMLAGAAQKAVETLEILMDAESESVRLGAARCVLELGSKFREVLEFEERIQQLEGIVHEAKLDESVGRH